MFLFRGQERLHGRLINVKLSLLDWQFQIMCIYAPNEPGGRSEFFSDLWRRTFPGYLCFLEVTSIALIVLSRQSWW